MKLTTARGSSSSPSTCHPAAARRGQVTRLTVKTFKGGPGGKTRAPRASPPSRSATARTRSGATAPPRYWTRPSSRTDRTAAAAAAARVASWMATARADHPATGSGAASYGATAPGCRAASSLACRGPRSPARVCPKLSASRSSPAAAAGRPSFSRDSRRPWLSREQLSARDRRAEKRVRFLLCVRLPRITAPTASAQRMPLASYKRPPPTETRCPRRATKLLMQVPPTHLARGAAAPRPVGTCTYVEINFRTPHAIDATSSP